MFLQPLCVQVFFFPYLFTMIFKPSSENAFCRCGFTKLAFLTKITDIYKPDLSLQVLNYLGN